MVSGTGFDEVDKDSFQPKIETLTRSHCGGLNDKYYLLPEGLDLNAWS